jgi:hypothetical protein
MTIVLAISAILCALAGFYIAGGNQVETEHLFQAKKAVSADASQSISPATHGSQERSIVNIKEWSFSDAVSDPSELSFVMRPKAVSTPLIENEVPPNSTKEPPPSSRKGETTTTRLESTTDLARLRESPPASDIESSKRLPINKSGGVKASQISAQYESKRRLPVRKSARFAAAVVHEIARGTLVNVLEIRGSWAKVAIEDGSISGFVRKEFLTPVSTASR